MDSLHGFWERFKLFVNVTDPRTLIYSDKDILHAKQLLEDDKNSILSSKPAKLTSEDREFYQKLVNSSVHPVTEEIIPRAFRVSAIAPVNIPLIWAMIACPASNVPGTLFLHWLNQSYNTACNYANRSGAEQSMTQLAKAYGLAVTSACSLAYGLGKIAARGPPILRASGAIIPCIATAAANVSNIGFTRMEEMTMGTKVIDEEGRDCGISAIAGRQCVGQTALTRCVLVPCACLMLPPFFMARLQSLRLLSTHPRWRMMVELAVIYLSLQLALPAALAVYPQTASFPADSLEPQFRHLVKADGSPVTTLYANKGL